MLRFQFIDNIHPAFTANNNIIWTNLFNAGTHFHADHPFEVDSLLINGLSTLAVRNPTLREIVRRQLYSNAISGYDADEVLPHLTGDMSYNLMAVFKFDSKLSPWKGLDNCARKLDYFLVYCHKYN
jgi:hypothetical protein